jgi:hypothetical protein
MRTQTKPSAGKKLIVGSSGWVALGRWPFKSDVSKLGFRPERTQAMRAQGPFDGSDDSWECSSS